MRNLDAADAVRRGSAWFNSAAFDIEIDHLIDSITPNLIARAAELGCDDATPVVIIGMPRSGTTLVEQIISSHPEVVAGGELNVWNERGGGLGAELARREPSGPSSAVPRPSISACCARSGRTRRE